MNRRFFINLALPSLALLMSLTSCSGLLAKQPLQTSYHTLEMPAEKTQFAPVTSADKTLPTLVIYPTKAAAGFNTRRMMYTRFPHQLEYYARNEWVDAPAEMLQNLMVSTMAQTGQFNAVLPKISQIKSDLRLESELVRLLQNFTQKPSQLQFTLRVAIIDNSTGKVIDQREFNETIATISDNPNGGVLAANQAVNRVLEQIAANTLQVVIKWQKTKV